MDDIRMIVYESLLEAEKQETPPGIIGRNMLNKYSYLDKQQRKFMHCLYEGVIDKKITLDYVIDTVSKVPVKKMKKPIRCIVRMGAYQILFMNSVPERAACNESVLIAKKKHLGNLSGFINGVLREICRVRNELKYPNENEDIRAYLSAMHSMPLLVVDSLLGDYGKDHTKSILENMDADRPVIGRTQCSRITTDELIGKINSNDNVCVKKIDGMDAFVFEQLDTLEDIDEFKNGLFTIQDISSQLVGCIAGYEKGNTVIDVCAAPGGKSAHAADILLNMDKDMPGRVIACDISEKKLSKIEENVARLGLDNVEIMLRDASANHPPIDFKADVVICDAPCSGLGVMARKRDIKYGLSKDGLDDLVNLQKKIINNSVSLIRKGGTFIYSTCTMRKAENDEQVKYIVEELGLEPVDFYDDLPDAYKDETARKGYIQLFAGEKGTDGFFISKFRTRA